jgi:cysteine desulfurase
MAPQLPIYLDYAATTPLDPRVLEAMLPALTNDFGNPSSRSHAFGWRADALVQNARQSIGTALGGGSGQIVFTSGATEANNLAVLGLARAARENGRHLVTSQAEHASVLDPMRFLETEGFRVTRLPPGQDGQTSPEAVAAAMEPDTLLVSVMTANNETGVVNPIGEIAKVCRERNVLFHTDAVQAFGKIHFDAVALGASLVTISAHKICGPKGSGALWIRPGLPRIRVAPLLFGGGQEKDLRPGTLNVPSILGMAAAARLAVEGLPDEGERVKKLRDRLEEGILAGVSDSVRNGDSVHRLPGILNLRFPGLDGDRLFLELRELAVSPGAACSSATLSPSHVLLAMGLSPSLAKASVRFSLGRFTTASEIEEAVRIVVAAVAKLRAAPII